MFLLKLITCLVPGMLSFTVMVPSSILCTGSFMCDNPLLCCCHCIFSLTLSMFKSHIKLPFLLLLQWGSQPIPVTPRTTVLCTLTLKERMGKELGMRTEVRGVFVFSHFYIAQACSTVQQTKVCFYYLETCILIYISRSQPILKI